MPLPRLDQEQLRTWTPAEKDRWWLASVYRGDVPQLTPRAVLTGIALGMVLALTNLYLGIRTGWALGVGVTSVIVAFAAFRLLSRVGLGRDLTVLESNSLQSIATAAGYMTSPLVASLPAYMLVTGRPIPLWQAFPWMVTLAVLGVLVAIPLKRRFLNDEQLPFPEGHATGVVMSGLHEAPGEEGLRRAGILAAGAGVSALLQLLRSEKVLQALGAPFLAIPRYWDALVYGHFTPRLGGIPLRDLDIRLDSSIVMLGTGGLLGIRTGASLLAGALVNSFVLAPWMMSRGIISGPGFRNIATWSLWWGVAMMTTSSLFSFFSRPGLVGRALRGRGGPSEGRDVLAHIELPLRVAAWGVPLAGVAVVAMGHLFFGVAWWMGAIALPLAFLFAIIAASATGLASVTPFGAMGKLTQLASGVLAPGDMATNLATAGITGGVASGASKLLVSLKPGHMLGAKPRHQAVGHVIGIVAGAASAVPVFHLLLGGDLQRLGSDAMPVPAAQVWRAVAELLARGLGAVHPTARVAMLVGGLLGIAMEWANLRRKGGFPLGGVGVGLAAVVQFPDALALALGSLLFWWLGLRLKPGRGAHAAFVENRETLCAGVVAGGATVGILLVVLEALLAG